jgi:hypothetical protein
MNGCGTTDTHQSTPPAGEWGVREGFIMPFVKCSVGGCSTKLQPILKVDPKDRDTWFYRECDICFRPVCDKHSSIIEDQIVCERCRKEMEAKQQASQLIDLGIRPGLKPNEDPK